jgi:hypothetical protein
MICGFLIGVIIAKIILKYFDVKKRKEILRKLDRLIGE